MTTASWLKLLKTCPTVRWDSALFRCVTKSSYDNGSPPTYLFTSGARNRCNPQDTLCIYMAEEQETALSEFNKYALSAKPEPFIVFTGHLKAERIIDLSDSATREQLGITEAHLYNPFRLQKSPTRLESLGLAISTQKGIAGIRFPSAASHSNGKAGNNLVIFKNSITPPDQLEIQNIDSTKPERWP